MADTGAKFPTNNGEDYNNFTNPANAYADNETYATSTISTSALYHDYYDFTFGVPEGATINGVEVKVEGYSNGELYEPYWLCALSHDGGTTYTANKGSYGTTDIRVAPEKIVTMGSSSDDWGKEDWDDTHFSNANFRVRIGHIQAYSTYTCYLDYITVKVYYTAGAEGTNTQINIGDAWKEVAGMQINIGDSWKAVAGAQVNIADTWKPIVLL